MAPHHDDKSDKPKDIGLIPWSPEPERNQREEKRSKWGPQDTLDSLLGPEKPAGWQGPWNAGDLVTQLDGPGEGVEGLGEEFLPLDAFLTDLQAEAKSEHGPREPEAPSLDGPAWGLFPSESSHEGLAEPTGTAEGPAQSGPPGPSSLLADSILPLFRPTTTEKAGDASGLDTARTQEVEKLAEAILFVRRQLKDLAKVVHQTRQQEEAPKTGQTQEILQLKARIDQLQRDIHGMATTVADVAAKQEQQPRETVAVMETHPPPPEPTRTAPTPGSPPVSLAAVPPASADARTEETETLTEEGLAAALTTRPTADQDTRPIDRLLRLLVQRGASDLHLTVGYAPMFRVAGDIEPLRYKRTRSEDWYRMIQPITTKRSWDQFVETGDVDFAYEIPDVGRFRVNLFRQHRGEGAVFRVIPDKILTIEQLGMPKQLHRIAKISGGLVLVTGPTGSGKSTTLAALVHEINETQPYHIITLEDPIEFVHHNKRSIIHQREIGTHTKDFATGLQDAVREDPNLLLVGEMRDLETIRLALESAAKGLLVFATLHTNNAAKTVERIVNVFPTDEQDTIRSVLADTIRAILAQQLVKRKDGGLVAAMEVLFGSPALSNLIRDGKTHQITNLIQTGRKEGMITMDEALMQLVHKGIISSEAAFEKAIEKSLFRDPEQARLEEEVLSTAQAQQGSPGSGSPEG